MTKGCLNPGPSGYEPDKLPGCSTAAVRYTLPKRQEALQC